jgi:hypothetical protein
VVCELCAAVSRFIKHWVHTLGAHDLPVGNLFCLQRLAPEPVLAVHPTNVWLMKMFV